ncbi:hypothetical protein D3C85_160590 [compost metagenome]
MLVADLAQALQVAARRRQHAGGAGHGLDDHGGDGRGVVQRDQRLERVGLVDAVRRLAAREGVARQVERVRQVVHAVEQRPEGAALAPDAAHRDAAEAHAVVRALAPDEPVAARVAARPVVGHRDLQRGVDRLGARVGEEHVVHAGRRHLREALRQREGGGVADLEVGGVVEHVDLRLHRRADPRVAVPGVHAPQAGDGVEHAAAVGQVVVQALAADDEARRLLELAVGREGHPERVERTGWRCQGIGGSHGVFLLGKRPVVRVGVGPILKSKLYFWREMYMVF